MDGNLPEKGTLPTSSEHPNSIFALLGKSHRMNVSEEATSVCPRDLCEDARLDEPFVDRLASMSEDLGLVYAHVVSPPGHRARPAIGVRDVGRLRRRHRGRRRRGRRRGRRRAISRTRARTSRATATTASTRGSRRSARGRPALNFKHALLPHVPWQYLPDGRQYRRTATEPIPGISRQSYKDQGQVDQLQLRHLLQAGLRRPRAPEDDRAAREARHLRRGADRRDRRPRRVVQQGAVRPARCEPREHRRDHARAAVHQGARARSGARSTHSIVETTDIIPTIPDLMSIELPEDVDGRSAFSAEVRRAVSCGCSSAASRASSD